MTSNLLIVASIVIPVALTTLAYLLNTQEIKGVWGRRMSKVAFLILAVIGILVAVYVEDSHRDKVATIEESHKKEVATLQHSIDQLQINDQSARIENAKDIGYLKAKLEDALHKGSEPSKLVTATDERIKQKSQQLSDKELAERVINWAKKMRQFESEYKQKYSQVSNKYSQAIADAKPEDRSRIWDIEQNELEQLDNAHQLEFRNNFLGEAVALRDELLKRLPSQTPSIEEKEKLIAFDGFLAGVSPISDAADYLEMLARKLSP